MGRQIAQVMGAAAIISGLTLVVVMVDVGFTFNGLLLAAWCVTAGWFAIRMNAEPRR
jgi:uncharacterized membrane protein HdeD (DUF308 family)